MASSMIASRVVAALVAALAPALLRAQDPSAARDSISPRAGSWAAELGIGSGQTATLLRFRSPTSAMLLGADMSWSDVSEDVPSVNGTRQERYTLANVTARVGVRRYRAATPAVRPFTSVGVLAGYSSDPGGPGWTAGAFGELGASYFFSPHVSLGAAGRLQAVYTRVSRQFSSGPSLVHRRFGIQAGAVQLLGAVYF